ncbi:MAG: hypothetical protein GY768_05495 [Planctomycetaceae bacterium]|nr:hypothetical protein [Planctomycetaceae bacterium]
MAWLIHKKSGIFHIGFRFDGAEITRSLGTRDLRAAESMRHRLEDTIELVQRGRLEISDDVPDVAAFLLSDGKISKERGKTKRLSVGELFASYSGSLPDNSIAAETLRVAEIHMRHVSKIIGAKHHQQHRAGEHRGKSGATDILYGESNECHKSAENECTGNTQMPAPVSS